MKSIAEIITIRGKINLDFRDVSKVLRDGGVAIMSFGKGSGEKRLADAIENALHSPLLNDNDIYNSKRILFNIYGSSEYPLKIEELDEIDAFTAKFEDNNIEVIWGIATDDSLGEEVKITILATGFGVSNIPGMDTTIHLNKEQSVSVASETPEAGVESEKREEKEQDKIARYYGDSSLRNYHFFVFEADDLLNDDLIDAVDSMPAYARSKQDLSELENKRRR